MIDCKEFYNLLKENEVDFFTGVPDSLLKDFCAYVTDNTQDKNNIIAANEGNAVALAAGHYLATKRIGLVYMQNSGLGNAVNPLLSLVDQLVYSIPMLLLIGWRGEPGIKDEPQHKKQGKVTLELLEAMGIKYKVISPTLNMDEVRKIVTNAIKYTIQNSEPYAFVVVKDTFKLYSLQKEIKAPYEMTREDVIKLVASNMNEKDVIVSTTGKASRELFEYRDQTDQSHKGDFLTVGSMGHSSQIALGIALEKPDRNVYCLDGDGAFIMHMGGLAIIGAQEIRNFKHIVINNGSHDSVGGQPTVGFKIDIPGIAQACGFKTVLTAKTKSDILYKLNMLKESKGPGLLEIKVNRESRKDLGRPNLTPIENRDMFIENIEL